MKKQITIKVADNSGTRRKNPTPYIWRNDVTGLEPGTIVTVLFYDDYTRNGCNKIKPRKYKVLGYKFDDAHAREINRHTVMLTKV